ncbi:MAG: hypothetical protein CME62_06360 [Halobacteriovoraceae bacterium]|nr:hypothetical protein [Halobacteriovoraceae bacterium]|tara:strand:- start:8165 stop:9481 length:1317 start_codon:yes stop_codon:yes gene_type:complete
MQKKQSFIFSFLLLLACTKNKVTPKPAHTLCETRSEMRSCPQKHGKIFLPRTYTARAIYLGYSEDEYHKEFLELIIQQVKQLETRPMVNILVPRTEDLFAYDHLVKYFAKKDYEFLNIIPTASNETIWAQDYMEILFDTKTGFSQIVDLPYIGREGETIPASIALSCQKELIEQDEFKSGNIPGNGDYGGNIEPITPKILTVGNNLTNETFNVLKASTSQELIDIDVQWLETGHVDELLTTLPLKKDAGPCEQTLLVASPKLGLELIKKLPMTEKPAKNQLMPFFDDYDNWPDLYHCLYPKNFKLKECLELYRANETYQAHIDKSVESLQLAINKHHQCRLKVESFPQIFVPLKKQKKYGEYTDRAIALNPNSVNNIFFYPTLILPKQIFPVFQEEVDKVLSQYPYKIIFANGKFVHELNGGIHCATNISYGCTPRAQ